MMTYAMKQDGVWVEITGPFVIDDISYPANWVHLVGDEDREAVGIYPIAEPEANTDPNLVPAGWTLVDVDGVPTRRVTMAHVPIPDTIDAWKGKLVLARMTITDPTTGSPTTLLQKAQEAVDGYATDESKVYWNAVPRWNRTHPLIAGIGVLLGFSSADVDQLFRDAWQAQ